MLQIAQLDPATAYSYSPGLFDAYATVLEELGRQDEAEEWYARAEVAADALEQGDDDDETIEVIEEDIELEDGPEGAVEADGEPDAQ